MATNEMKRTGIKWHILSFSHAKRFIRLLNHVNNIPSYSTFQLKFGSLFQSILYLRIKSSFTLQWLHNGRSSVSNHQPHDCFLNRFFRRISMKTSRLRVTGLCGGNSPGTGVFPAQMASNAGNVSIWWRHHATKAWRMRVNQTHVAI